MPQFQPLHFWQEQEPHLPDRRQEQEPYHDVVPLAIPVSSVAGKASCGETGQPATTVTSATPEPLQSLAQPTFLTPGPQSGLLFQQAPTPGPLSDIAAAESLLAVLQATTSATTRKQLVVIPGSRKRTSLAHPSSQRNVSPRRIPPRIRYAITFGSLVGVLLMTLLSLAPLDNGQSTFLLFGTAMQWARAQESGWSILGHTLPVTPTTAPVVAAPPPASLPQSQYVAVAQQDAINAGIPPNYFVRQINQESGFNPNAVSPAGAVGIAQFLPSTAAGLGINPWDPLQSLQAAAHLMASYSNQYGGDYAMALAAYNAGTGTVQYAINTCGAANWMNCLPAETQNYIYTIMGV